jgi:hypothetical protein
MKLLALLTTLLLTLTPSAWAIDRPNMMSCFVRWQGPCSSINGVITSAQVLTFIQASNDNIRRCGKYADPAQLAGSLINDERIDATFDMPCTNTTAHPLPLPPAVVALSETFSYPYDVNNVFGLSAAYSMFGACLNVLLARVVANSQPPMTTLLFNVHNMNAYGMGEQKAANMTHLIVWVRADRVPS